MTGKFSYSIPSFHDYLLNDQERSADLVETNLLSQIRIIDPNTPFLFWISPGNIIRLRMGTTCIHAPLWQIQIYRERSIFNESDPHSWLNRACHYTKASREGFRVDWDPSKTDSSLRDWRAFLLRLPGIFESIIISIWAWINSPRNAVVASHSPCRSAWHDCKIPDIQKDTLTARSWSQYCWASYRGVFSTIYRPWFGNWAALFVCNRDIEFAKMNWKSSRIRVFEAEPAKRQCITFKTIDRSVPSVMLQLLII